eukprot:14993605-Alexandrium_andersonii.AAC.1
MLRTKPRQRAERSSRKPGICQQMGTPTRKAQPWGRCASRGTPRAGIFSGLFSPLARLRPQPR